jgi:hypothetical protein
MQQLSFEVRCSIIKGLFTSRSSLSTSTMATMTGAPAKEGSSVRTGCAVRAVMGCCDVSQAVLQWIVYFQVLLIFLSLDSWQSVSINKVNQWNK